MTDDPATKTCPICCMAIPARARRCPHCRHWQNRITHLLLHPAVGVVLVAISLGVYLVTISRMLDEVFGQGEAFHAYADQVRVVASEISFGTRGSDPAVAVVGRVENASPVDWKEVTFQVEFLDPDGRLVDAGQAHEYSFRLPRHDTLAFRVSFPRELAEDAYARHAIRVVSARDARAGF